MQSIERVGIDLKSKFVRNGGYVQQRICRTRDGRVNHNRILKGIHRNDVARLDSHLNELHHLSSRAICHLK